MELLADFLRKDKVKQILNSRPGDEGFSLVELVVVIAVLSILSAVAIPAFQGVQDRAKASAVKNGLVNGVKECIVSDGLNLGTLHDVSQAYRGDYTGYEIQRFNNQDTCYKAYADPDANTDGTVTMPWFAIVYNSQDGTSTKTCNKTFDKIGCSSAGDW